MANLCGLAAARHALLARQGWDVEARGLFEAPPITVVVGDEVHVSLLKALSLLGFGRARVTRVPVDDQGRMRADGLPALDDRTIVCLQAGNVNTGAFDPADAIVPIARAAGAWVHVDGAFGLWAAAAPSRAHLMRGYADADSWATDAHKWLNVPYDSGLAIIREPRHLREAMTATASYLIADDRRDPSDFTPELSRRSRGIEIWAALRSLGRQGLADLVERNCRQAARFAERLRQRGYTVLNDVVINQVMVSFGDAEITRRVIAAVQRDGVCWMGGTVWQGHTAMRISVSSWMTTDDDVDRSVEAIARAAAGSDVRRDKPGGRGRVMPELPEVETVRRMLEPVMAGARFEAVIARRADLRGPLPENFAARLIGTRAMAVTRRAKYLVTPLSSGETLVMHLGMSGWFRVDRDEDVRGGDRHGDDELGDARDGDGHADGGGPSPALLLVANPHDHVLFRMSSGAVVTFNDPRRFGSMELVAAGELPHHPALGKLGPEPLSPEFDAFALARACRGKSVSLKVALLDQRVVAGLGNIYAAEALHRARLSPRRAASTIATPSGLPRDSAHRLTAAIKRVLTAAIDRVAAENAPGGEYRASRFRVYDREGAKCPTTGCGGTIRRIDQTGRSTFYCPRCQK